MVFAWDAVEGSWKWGKDSLPNVSFSTPIWAWTFSWGLGYTCEEGVGPALP